MSSGRFSACAHRKLSIAAEAGDPREKFSSNRPGGRIVVRVFVSRGHLPDEIKTGRLNLIRGDVTHIGPWIAERRDDLARFVVGLRGWRAIVIFIPRTRGLPFAN